MLLGPCSGSFGVGWELICFVALSDLALEMLSGMLSWLWRCSWGSTQQWAGAALTLELLLCPWSCTQEPGAGLVCRSCYPHPLGNPGREEAALGKYKFGAQHSELSLPSPPCRLSTPWDGKGELQAEALRCGSPGRFRGAPCTLKGTKSHPAGAQGMCLCPWQCQAPPDMRLGRESSAKVFNKQKPVSALV